MALSPMHWKRVGGELLWRSVVEAHRADPASWGVTPREDSFNLNVGMVQTLTLLSNGVFVNCDGTETRVFARPGVSVIEEKPDQRYRSLLNAGHDYVIVFAAPASAAKLYELIWERHRRYIWAAADTKRNPRTRRGHSQAHLDELGRLIGCKFPEPRNA